MTDEQITTKVDGWIPVQNLSKLATTMTTLKRAANRITKRGDWVVRAPSYELGETKTKTQVFTQEDGSSGQRDIGYQHVTIFFYADLNMGDYDFLGVLETVGDSFVISSSPDIEFEMPTWHKDLCHHCYRKIKRTKYFLFREKGKRKIRQIGSVCLKDYLGHPDAEAVLNALQWLFSDDGGGDGRYGKNDPFREIVTTVAFAIRAIKDYGFRKTDNYIVSTKAIVEQFSAPSPSTGKWLKGINEELRKSGEDLELKTVKPNDSDYSEAAEIIEWATGVNTDGNNYLHNVQALASAGTFHKKFMGTAVSIPQAYYRHLENKEERAKLEAQWAKEAEDRKAKYEGCEWVGEIGERLALLVTVTDEKQVFSDFGESSLVTMESEGNIFITFAQSTSGFGDAVSEAGVGAKIAIRGTVKSHDLFRELKQTKLTRVMVDTKYKEKTV